MSAVCAITIAPLTARRAVGTVQGMPRWEPDGFERLQAAASELFDERGFKPKTVAANAQRAGLTQRTFFNHFADKREVLFGLESAFQQEIVREIAGSANTVSPLDAVVHALQTVSDMMFEVRRAAVIRRHRIIGANPELRERELTRRAALTDAMAAALVERGLDSETALIAAGAGMVVYQTAIARWTRPAESQPLRELLSDARESLRSTVSQ